MRLPIWGHILLVVFGGVVVLAGALAWSVDPYGGSGFDPELIMEIDGDTVRIYEFYEHGPLDSEGNPLQSKFLVFEGSQEEADAFLAEPPAEAFAEPQGEDRNNLVPALIIAVGAVIVIVALIPVRKTQFVRRAAVFVITVVVGLPVTLIVILFGMEVPAFVIFPIATLAAGVITALVAGGSGQAGRGWLPHRHRSGGLAQPRLGDYSGDSLTVPGCAATWLPRFGCRLLHGSWSHTSRFPPQNPRHVDYLRPSDYCRLVGRDRDRTRFDPAIGGTEKSRAPV